MNAEQQRLHDVRTGVAAWKTWGPYLSERQWGTVREDYSEHGNAWEYFPHDHARSRAYRWGEDGLAGFSDDQQRLCLGLALWNGADPILKERLFGLTGNQGNHGEDVKELYYYLDALPSHAYQKMLYKYPQAAFPYEQLVAENARRSKQEAEFELLDTGVFDDDRYFDIFVEYAQATPGDILMQITVHNRNSQPAYLDLIPQIWFRNDWSWAPGKQRPRLCATSGSSITVEHRYFDDRRFSFEAPAHLLFCDNETNVDRLFGVTTADGTFPKDGINDAIVHRRSDAVNPKQQGTKAGVHHAIPLAGHGQKIVRLRLHRPDMERPFADFDQIMAERRNQADLFYADLQRDVVGVDERMIHRQALAGLLWSKQYYFFDLDTWISGDPLQPPPPATRKNGRNRDWMHLHNSEIISMPDKWEYPWYAAWDLAFHCVPFTLVDPDFAKEQLVLLTREWYMHPNGQLPAYEWAFGDVNPPVHAWAAWRVYKIDQKQAGGQGDLQFLERVFQKLLLNFTWWVNRKDAEGNNIFQGGFLGLDNIGAFDRSSVLPGGSHVEQADGTSWMAMYSLNMLRIALELSRTNPVYQDMASKFFEHFMYIAGALVDIGGHGMSLWDEEDKFFYDALHLSDGTFQRMKLRSMVGLIPLFAVETLEPELLTSLPEFSKRMEWFLRNRPDLASLVSRWQEPGSGERRLLSLLRGHRMKRILSRMLDETEFLSPYGIRALSKSYEEQPYMCRIGEESFTLSYQPGESDSGLFGGNSNWRGPIWFPVNFLIIESLQKFHHYYGDDFKVEYPTGSGQFMTINEIATELGQRLVRIFTRDQSGRRAVFGENDRLQTDPHFRDYLLFHEYFHGDSGRGVGASHQTGWTALVAKLLHTRRDEVAERQTVQSTGTGRTESSRS